VRDYGRKEAQKDAIKAKSKKLLRVTCNGLAKFFVNFVLFCGCKTILPRRGAKKREKRKGGNGKREEWSSYALRGYGVTGESEGEGWREGLPQKGTRSHEKRMLPNSFFFQTQQSFRSINFGTARSFHATALEGIENAFCYFFRCGVFYHDFLIKIGLLPLLSK
jgi:hypothetical protein